VRNQGVRRRLEKKRRFGRQERDPKHYETQINTNNKHVFRKNLACDSLLEVTIYLPLI